MLPIDVAYTWVQFLRMACRSFAEGAFIYYLFSTDISNFSIYQKINSFSKKNMVLFSLAYSLIAAVLVTFCDVGTLYRLVSVVFVFLYFWHKQRKTKKKLVSNYDGIYDIKYTLSAAVILVLAVHSFNYISHMVLHTSFVLTDTYNIVRSNSVFYELYYKYAIMFLHVFFIFLAYKFQFIKMKDIKAMSVHKWVPISFGLCLLTMVYIDYTYYIFGNTPLTGHYRNVLLWAMAFIVPTYFAFYLVIKQLTMSINLMANTVADEHIHVWVFNPAIIETTHLDIYDSALFMASFESKKIILKRKLKKLGIDNRSKGYSALLFCLFLTRLFMGFKNWSFERDIFGQASLVIDMPLSKLRKDIENIIEYVWTINDAQTLIDGYYLPYHNSNVYDQTHHPKIEEFLIDVAKSI